MGKDMGFVETVNFFFLVFETYMDFSPEPIPQTNLVKLFPKTNKQTKKVSPRRYTGSDRSWEPEFVGGHIDPNVGHGDKGRVYYVKTR